MLNRFSFRSLVLVTAFMGVPSPALAAVTPAQEKQAEALLASGKASDAAQLLRGRIAPSDSPQAWFLMGKSAEQSGDFAGAAAAYRQVLAKDPKAQRVKLDLARVLQQQGDNSNAERLYHEVRATHPPAQVVANIDRYLAMMNNRDQQGSAWRARATIGTGYDSNPGTATSAREVTMFGLPFTLSKEARKRGDGFAFFKGEIDHIYRFNREFAWTSNLTLGARKYFQLGDYDNFTFNASTGPVWQPGDRTTVLLPGYVNVSRFETAAKNFNDRWHSWEVGVAPQVRFAATDWLNLNLGTTLGRRTYFTDGNKDATVGSVSPGFDIRTANMGTFTLGATYGREAARVASYSNQSLGLNLGWQYAFTKNFVSSAYGTYTDSRYDEAEAIYGTDKRHDKRTVLGLDLIYTWDAIQADILLSYSRTWNQSNLPIYTYDKDTVSLAVRKAF